MLNCSQFPLTFFYNSLNQNFLGEGFGFNTNILETNLINLAIVISIVIYFGGPFLDSLLTTRKNAIFLNLQEIENRYKQTTTLFDKVKKEREQAKEKAKLINEQALQTISQLKIQLNEDFEKDIEKLEQTKKITIEFEKEKVLTQIRQQISQLALKQANQKIKTQLTNPSFQRKLIDQKINGLNNIL